MLVHVSDYDAVSTVIPVITSTGLGSAPIQLQRRIFRGHVQTEP